MRWLVEVTPLGKAETDSVTVDADSWHKALERARLQRGEAAQLNGFSIELLAIGCRAIDPASRLRYTVTSLGEAAAPAAVPKFSGSSSNAREIATPDAVPFDVVFRREEAPTDAVPLTYREYVLSVPSGTTEGSADELLRRHLKTVRAALVDMPAGKVVNLAVFEAPFVEPPVTRPLATLTWKDWNAEPSVGFPRSAVSSAPGIPLAKGGTLHVDKPQSAPPAAEPVSPAAPIANAPGAREVSAQTADPPSDRPASARMSPQPMGTAELLGSSSSVGAMGPRPRMRADELLGELFESMHELQFVRDPISGGDLCLTIATEAIPSRAGIVHLYDMGRREFVVASTSGEAIKRLTSRRHPESDAMLSRAMRSPEALVIASLADDEMPVAPRYVELGGVRSLVVARATVRGRCFGAIELIDPLDGFPFTTVEGNAIAYIAQQFAEFVASRGSAVELPAQGPPRGR